MNCKSATEGKAKSVRKVSIRMNVDKNGVSEFARLSNYLNEIDLLCDNITQVSDLFLPC